jgi:hypothetical protein
MNQARLLHQPGLHLSERLCKEKLLLLLEGETSAVMEEETETDGLCNLRHKLYKRSKRCFNEYLREVEYLYIQIISNKYQC